jgi:hypothetical protein
MLSLENLLFRMEDLSRFNKQNLFLTKFIELQTGLTCLSYCGSNMIIDHTNLQSLLKGRTFPSSMSQRSILRLRSDLRDFGRTLTSMQRRRVLDRLLSDLNFPVAKVFGCTIDGNSFYRLDDPVRFKHALGLADAVDLTMTQVNVRIRFRTKTSVPIQQLDFYHGIGSTVLSSVNLRKKMLCRSSRHNKYLLLLHYLRVFPRDVAEKRYTKVIKLLLAGEFSLQLLQELPPGFKELGYRCFPKSAQIRLDNALSNRKQRCQFYFGLLQSKALCAPVGQDMIDEAICQHRSSICRPQKDTIPIDNGIAVKLHALGKTFGKRMVDCGFFQPLETSLPNTHSCIEESRSKNESKIGGSLKALLGKKGRIVSYTGNPLLQGETDGTRFEPLVIGLFGAPACGKTVMVNHITSFLKAFFPEIQPDQRVYSRSMATTHWDGYTQQPIVILDDFGQDRTNRGDIAEFAQLVSVNPYLLPMAALKDKGMYFTSPIIILTSNCQYGSQLCDPMGQPVVEDSWAIWRRIHLPYYLENHKEINPQTGLPMYVNHSLTPFTILPSDFNVTAWDTKYGTRTASHSTSVPTSNIHHVDVRGRKTSALGDPTTLVQFQAKVEQVLRTRMLFHESNLTGTWTQIISRQRVEVFEDGILIEPHVRPIQFPIDSRDHTLAMQFPNCPPLDFPQVKPVAIAEPLKVRMITAAECDTKCLQPLQKGLWQTLGTYPSMCLTNGVKDLESFSSETLPWIERIEVVIQKIRDDSSEDDPWLSGDYTAATDNLPMWVTEALLEGILENITHEPTKCWARWEISPHEVLYKDEHGGPATQTSGQLMGSLLSFPLLCLANYFTLIEAGFQPNQFLVNGDDVVAKGPEEKITTWRGLAPRIGLSLSVGKNFIDPEFCTINSQLFFNGEVQHTGKVSLQKRQGTTIGYCFQEAQYYYGPSQLIKSEFIRRNIMALRKIPRSLDLPVSLGGLAMYNTLFETRNRYDFGSIKTVYMYDLLRKFIHPLYFGTESGKKDFAIVRVPVHSGPGIESLLAKLAEKGQDTRPPTCVAVDRLLSLRVTDPKELLPKDPDFSDIRKFKKNLDCDELRVFKSVIQDPQYNILKFPPLTAFGVNYVLVVRSKAEEIQKLVLKYFTRYWLSLVEGGVASQDPFSYFDMDYQDFEEFNVKLKFSSIVLQELLSQPTCGQTVSPFWEELPPLGNLKLKHQKFLRLCEQGYTRPLDGSPAQLPEIFQKFKLTQELSLVGRARPDQSGMTDLFKVIPTDDTKTLEYSRFDSTNSDCSV